MCKKEFCFLRNHKFLSPQFLILLSRAKEHLTRMTKSSTRGWIKSWTAYKIWNFFLFSSWVSSRGADVYVYGSCELDWQYYHFVFWHWIALNLPLLLSPKKSRKSFFSENIFALWSRRGGGGGGGGTKNLF